MGKENGAITLHTNIAAPARARAHRSQLPTFFVIVDLRTEKPARRSNDSQKSCVDSCKRLGVARAKTVTRRAPAKKTAARKTRVVESAIAPTADEVLVELRKNASAKFRADMSTRYGIVTKAEAYGTPVAALKKIAKKIGRDHALAEALWQTGVHDARMLATMIDDPEQVTRAQMKRWAKGFDNWGIVDTACFHLFDRSPHPFAQIERWASAKDEMVKRAAFALLASCALHGIGTDADHLRGLGWIESAASDDRNFVKKGVNWAFRAIAQKKSPTLRAAARSLAEKLTASDDATARWQGRSVLKTK